MFHSIAISSETGNWYCLTGTDLTHIREVVLLSTLYAGHLLELRLLPICCFSKEFACTCTCQKTSLVLSIALCPYTHARRIRLLLRRGRGGVFCVRASTKGWVLGTTRDPRYSESWSEGTVWSVRALKTLSPPGIEPGAGELVASMLTTAPIDWVGFSCGWQHLQRHQLCARSGSAIRCRYDFVASALW